MSPEEKKHWYGLDSGTRIQLRTATQDSTEPPEGETYVIKQTRIINANETKSKTLGQRSFRLDQLSLRHQLQDYYPTNLDLSSLKMTALMQAI